jgi:hypothetical protein
VRRIDGDLVACGTRNSLSSWTRADRGIGCARDKIRNTFDAARPPSGRVVVDRFEASSERTHGPAPLENVYLVVEGSDPALRKTAFLVSGHFDSMCSDVMSPDCDAPGADDDASGTTVSLASALTIARRPHRATLVFAAVSGRSRPSRGKRLLEWARGQGYTVGGMLNNDIVGASNGAADVRPRVFCDTEAFTPARELGLWIDEFVGGVRPVFRKDRFGRGGDHLPFVEAGLPAVRFCEPKKTTGISIRPVPRTASSSAISRSSWTSNCCPRWRASTPRRSTGSATPRPSRGGDGGGAVAPAATVISRRRTTRNGPASILEREHRGAVEAPGGRPAPGSYTVPVTIDDAFFAVRSVGKNGVRSIAVDASPWSRGKDDVSRWEAPRSGYETSCRRRVVEMLRHLDDRAGDVRVARRRSVPIAFVGVRSCRRSS